MNKTYLLCFDLLSLRALLYLLVLLCFYGYVDLLCFALLCLLLLLYFATKLGLECFSWLELPRGVLDLVACFPLVCFVCLLSLIYLLSLFAWHCFAYLFYLLIICEA